MILSVDNLIKLIDGGEEICLISFIKIETLISVGGVDISAPVHAETGQSEYFFALLLGGLSALGGCR